ncbi:hypothetical protein F5144DRAFT_593009 [Chaetomium tenue]|uniref:Uncharacterized protein n=1 Tax=Chaetomium tenue TaxID=1854479 RepID=A0ACB7P9S0_9PEZI|nr:hypothetical protein F5144DRAFT_593009 [Chaetomium globosum]
MNICLRTKPEESRLTTPDRQQGEWTAPEEDPADHCHLARAVDAFQAAAWFWSSVEAFLEDDHTRADAAERGAAEPSDSDADDQDRAAASSAATIASPAVSAAAAPTSVADANDPAYVSLVAGVDAMDLDDVAVRRASHPNFYVMASPQQAWSLTGHLLATEEQLYKSATQHPFLLAGAEGRLPKDILSHWLANDRLYIHSYIRAAGQFLASIDLPKQVSGSQEAFETRLVDWVTEALVAIRKEERFFIDVADRYNLGIEIAVPFPATSAVAQDTRSKASTQGGKLPGFVQLESLFSSVGTHPTTADSPNTLSGGSLVRSLFTSSAATTTPPTLLPWLEGALTFWGTERCYLDAWSWARDKAEERRSSGEDAGKEDADGGALRKEFIPNWSSPEFSRFVEELGKMIDDAVAEVVQGKEGEEQEKVKEAILGRVEGKWRTLLEAEKECWPDALDAEARICHAARVLHRAKSRDKIGMATSISTTPVTDSMIDSDETTASKLIEVLSRIDTTLGTLDRRLQILEKSWPPAQTGAIIPVAVPDANRALKTEHSGFVTKSKTDLDGSSHLQEIIVEDSDLLALLLCASSPCLNRQQTRQATSIGHRTFTYPFTDLLSYRDVLKFLIHESEEPDSELRSLYADHEASHALTPRLKIQTADLLACCDGQCRTLVRSRDANIARGVVLFDDLPTIFSPGMLLVGPGGEGLEQVVEVSSCDMITGTATTEACVVQVWHFRWDGKGFSRTSSRFELGRYSGARPIKGFPYYPVIGLDTEQSVARLGELVARNKKHLALLQEISEVEVGDYPLCVWESEFSDGFRRGSTAVKTILDPAAFSLYNEEPLQTTATFGCYCSGCTSSISSEDVLRSARYLLLAPTKVEGFLLIAKKWTTFPIGELRLVEPSWWNAETLETVALDENTVCFLKEKITEHFAWRMEVVEGTNQYPLTAEHISRKAFVAQFHGPEGVGKALTASSLADYCHRPTLRLSPDDLGLESESFANRLSLYSELSFRWGAVMIFSEADNMLQSRRLDGLIRNPLGEGGHRPSIHLVRYIRQVSFPLPSPEDIKKMFTSYLSQLDPEFVEPGDVMVNWVTATATTLRLSVRQFRDIFQRAAAHADRGNRKLNLSSLIKAYTSTTGRPDEWSFIADTSLYGSSQVSEGTTAPAVTKLLRDAFGSWSELPDDGRLPLTISETFYSGAPSDSAVQGASALEKATEELQKCGAMWIVDWGWPRGIWYPMQGCAYTPSGLYRWIAPDIKHPREEWERAGFTVGLADLILNQEHDGFQSGSPWRRLVLVEAHVQATTLQSFGPAASITRLDPLNQDLEDTPEPDLQFHIAFFHLIALESGNIGGLRNTTQFFNAPTVGMSKGCFTIFPVPLVNESPPLTGPIHWTLICLTPQSFWAPFIYETCAAPTLRAQTTYYVAEALRTVVAGWREILQATENLVDSDSVLRQPDQLQDILFDDDAFSTSKRYFWAINFIHEADKLLDDAIQQWVRFRKRSVTPWTTMGSQSDREYYWYEKSQEVLATADQVAEESCEDLKRLRQEFQEKLERITIMRDGVSCPAQSAIWISAIWSINESYSSTNLAIVTVVVAVATYALTFNLNNAVHGLQKIYGPKRRALIGRMERDPNPTWQWFGDRFKVFERAERGQQRPSEWIIWAYFFRRMWRVVLRKRDSRPEEMGEGWSL